MSFATKIAFVTSEKHADLTPDDRLAIPHLEALGISVTPLVWGKSPEECRAFDALVIRSCWDYVEKLDAFLDWLSALKEAGIAVWNSPPVLIWNTSKGYLQSLLEHEIPIVPTVWLLGSESIEEWEETVATMLFDDIVVKPVVSAGGKGTYRLKRGPDGMFTIPKDLAGQGAMAQPYLREIESYGEVSFLFFNKEFSHAVRKTPQSGQFLVQEAFGGKTVPITPPPEWLAQAQAVVDAVEAPLLYARVDMIPTQRGSQTRLLLGELELAEPFLYLEHDPAAPKRFAEAIRARQKAGF